MAQVRERFTHLHTLIKVSQAARNVIFIGETGSGKSSVINLIANQNHAMVSPDVKPCTREVAYYDVSIGERTYRLWDTPGLNEATGFDRFLGRSTSATSAVRRFLQERYKCGELDLLVFCVQGRRASSVMSRAYKVFCEATRRVGISVVIALTHLEREQPTMEAWWQNNERRLRELGLIFDGHACLTCLSSHHRRWASQQGICHLITAEYRPRVSSPLDPEYLLSDPKSCVVC